MQLSTHIHIYFSSSVNYSLLLIHTDCPDGRNLLLNGSDLTEGWVEVCYNNSYGTVCDDFWDELDAQVVYHRLGFDNGSKFRINVFVGVMHSSCTAFNWLHYT